jgi:hypothetical protein
MKSYTIQTSRLSLGEETYERREENPSAYASAYRMLGRLISPADSFALLPLPVYLLSPLSSPLSPLSLPSRNE